MFLKVAKLVRSSAISTYRVNSLQFRKQSIPLKCQVQKPNNLFVPFRKFSNLRIQGNLDL